MTSALQLIGLIPLWRNICANYTWLFWIWEFVGVKFIYVKCPCITRYFYITTRAVFFEEKKNCTITIVSYSIINYSCSSVAVGMLALGRNIRHEITLAVALLCYEQARLLTSGLHNNKRIAYFGFCKISSRMNDTDISFIH